MSNVVFQKGTEVEVSDIFKLFRNGGILADSSELGFKGPILSVCHRKNGTWYRLGNNRSYRMNNLKYITGETICKSCKTRWTGDVRKCPACDERAPGVK